MTDRLFVVFLVAVFILVLGGTGALTNGAPVSVPWAEAIVPAGDDDDDGPPDLDDLNCDELLDLAFELIEDPFDSAQFIDLDELKKLVAECIASGGSGGSSLRERLLSGVPFTLNILSDGNFVGVTGTYDPATGMYTGNGTGTVAGFENVTVVMQLTIANDGMITGTYSMGAGGELPGGVPTIYSVTGTFPLTTPTPTPSASPTLSPTDTPTPTPTTPPGQQVTWADSNCKDGVDPIDSLIVLRGDAGLSANTNECPPMGASIEVLLASPHTWGDVDCKDGMTPVDSLKILRYDAGLSVSQEPGCPAMASMVTIVEL